ncbi:2Fe-2S iron-sulfur cluster binding domain-containing protein [Mycobacterium sp. TY814]|uniref:2Fe-2S iron-sulfur cluster binding domain-containing protein n=1 Tax=unclassified Mycobacterium TaxID=2642494 RepID=UPI002742219C|nr:2Fe-2S iron-sulfur cluster binding domain-containing protein [Mycobacterium sp. TY814]MDP7723943.1 2Fe-2S iron-sulfur cluster binding domain-containing protein [Mycobacterium sp. TY814]
MTEIADTPTDTELRCYDVVLTTTEGKQSTIRCDSRTTVLEAAEGSGLVLKSACQAGGCGACSAVLSEGHVEMGDHDPDVIETPEEEGGILLCRSYPRADCRIDLPYDRGQVVTAQPTLHRARISGLDPVADTVVRLRLTLLPDSDGSCSADFESGQFVRITVPGTEARRAYSPANVANWDGTLEFYIRLLPGGLMSEYLAGTAAVGDDLTVSSARGDFALAENGLRPRWFIAGGTGLSPLLSMLGRMAEWGDAQPARLFFGVTRHTEVFGQDQLRALASSLPDFRFDTVVWQPDPEWAGATGNPVELAAAEAALLDEWPDVYVCGPPPMVDAAYAALTAAGIPRDQIHAERFSAVQ